MTRAQLGLVVDLGNELTAEVLPDDPPTPLDAAWAAHRATPERMRRYVCRAWAADGTLAGTVSARVDPDDTDNPDVLGTQIIVRKAYRRRGVGLQLLAYIVGVARAESRTRIIGNTIAALPASEAFARAVGAAAKSEVHMNHLPTAEVDRALMQTWVDDGPRRAADYELLSWDGPIPAEHLDAFIDLFLVMNDAPRDDLDVNDFTMTPAQWREQEQQLAAVGAEHWTLVAQRKSDGAFAGFHDVFWVPHEPNIVDVGATGVRPEHRGHALGKWLKAAMTLRILDERPDVDDIRTGNADSNDAMLGINHEMGYRPLVGATVWELDVEAAATILKERGVEIPTVTRR